MHKQNIDTAYPLCPLNIDIRFLRVLWVSLVGKYECGYERKCSAILITQPTLTRISIYTHPYPLNFRLGGTQGAKLFFVGLEGMLYQSLADNLT